MTPDQLKTIESTTVPVVIHRDGMILFANQAAVEMVRADHAFDILGKDVVSFLTAPYRLAAKVRHQRIEAGKPLLLKNPTAKLIRLDGTTFDATAKAFLVDYQDGKSILSAVIDYTKPPKGDELDSLLAAFGQSV